MYVAFFFSSRRRHTRCALVTGVHTCALPICKRLIGLPMNVEYKALAAEGKTAHGLSPVVVILDELGQVRGSQDPFVEALETAQGAYDDGLQLVILTQAPTDADMLSVWIDDAVRSDDPH